MKVEILTDWQVILFIHMQSINMC